ncbi:MAG: hypothetical protein P8077_08525 [Gammaproteobacteria bacterium]
MPNITYTEPNRYSNTIFTHLRAQAQDKLCKNGRLEQLVIIGTGKDNSTSAPCPQVNELLSTLRECGAKHILLKLIEIDQIGHQHAKKVIDDNALSDVRLDPASQSTRDITNAQDRNLDLGKENQFVVMTQVLHHATRCYSLKKMNEDQKSLIRNIMQDIFHSLSHTAVVYLDAFSYLLLKKAFGSEEKVK